MMKEAEGKNVTAAYTLEEFVNSLETPRKILLMVKAGAATDVTIEQLKPLLEKGDIVIDGGNTFFKDTQRRNEELSKLGIHFIGTGVSGGGRRSSNRSFHHAWRSKKKHMNLLHRF
ncbi:NAD(P)-binding domain-containing protein [Peribacillus frigoritolerans]|nr:NAD(P)-binding domain-containing protein [Peribacillus frigoritolerans]